MAAALVVTGCGKAEVPARQVNAARVPVVAATMGSVTPQNTLGGLIVPFQNVQIVSTLVEPVNAVYVIEGDRVSKGQTLAQLDTKDLEAQLQSVLGTIAADEAKTKQTTLQAGLTVSQNSNSINAAQATVRQAQQTLANDTANLNRDAQLIKQGYLSQQAYDTQRSLVANDSQAVRAAQVALQNLQTQVVANGSTTTGLQGATVASAKADEQVAQGQAQQLRVQIAKARIVSPIDGVVVNRNLNPGEYPGTRQLFTLQQTDKVYAVLNGSGAQIVGVRIGSPVKIAASDRATMRGMARVSAVLDQVTPGSTNFVVKAVLPNPQNLFRSGMVVTGLVTRPTTSGVMIPRTAFNDDTQTTVQTIVKAPPVPGGGFGAGGPGGPGGAGAGAGSGGAPGAGADSGAGGGTGSGGAAGGGPGAGGGAGAGGGPGAGGGAGPGGAPGAGGAGRRRAAQVVKTIPVVMVAEDGKNAIVQGLNDGQDIVINGQLGLSDGQPAEPCKGDACKVQRGPGGPGGPGGRKVAER